MGTNEVGKWEQEKRANGNNANKRTGQVGTSEEGECEQREHMKRASGNNGKNRRGKMGTRGTSKKGDWEQQEQEKREYWFWISVILKVSLK